MSEFRMPSLGADMDAATVLEWQVKPGDRISKGDVICVVETSKGAIEVDVFHDGVIEELYVAPDTAVPVGTPLARIRLESEESGPGPATAPRAEPAAGPAPTPVPAPGLKPEPAREPPAAPPAPPPSLRYGPEPVATPGRVRASPAARRHAARSGVDLGAIRGSGPGGAVLLADLASAQAPATPPPARPVRGFDPAQMRQAIAAAMARAKREIPHYYLDTAIDMRSALRWLQAYNAERDPEMRMLPAALLLRATALALTRYPEFNGFFADGRFQPAESVHLGVAVNLRGGGLITPAIMNTETLDLPALMGRFRDLVQRTRQGGLRSSEMMNGTATVTALGERGVDRVFGVIFPPQVAIVGFGRIRARPWVVEDGLAVRPVLQATLAADHRVSDGRRGALLLRQIDALLQEPAAL